MHYLKDITNEFTWKWWGAWKCLHVTEPELFVQTSVAPQDLLPSSALVHSALGSFSSPFSLPLRPNISSLDTFDQWLISPFSCKAAFFFSPHLCSPTHTVHTSCFHTPSSPARSTVCIIYNTGVSWSRRRCMFSHTYVQCPTQGLAWKIQYKKA